MSQQIQITGGAKVRALEGVITGTSGVLSSVPLGAANGVATLDSGGKVPVSQLPSSVVTYLGTWNAATNTPTLTNGVGDAGDMYICNVAGTVNFGAGPVTFAVGDWVLYGSGTWQKSNGQNGTVTSVAASITGSAIGLTGSPITTAGTLAFAFSGTSGQYVNGAGNLTTFPTLITSIGLSMPSAFSVANSPLTANGTIAVTGAGTTAQYIRGDGSLATFPTIATEAQRLITEVYNETGATLTKGTVVYINGGHGNLPTVTKAIATGDATSAQTYGIVQTDITNNNNGYVVVIGSLGDLDTQAYANGTQLYLSSTVAGAWTSVKQYAPAHLVYVAIVTRSHPTQGVVEVRIQNGFEMDELHNVSAQSPLNNQGLFYNTSTSLWENKSIATALGYTPANDSLVVHLAGTETITGIKTFSNGLNSDYIGVTGDISMDGSFSLKQVAYGTLQSGYTNLSGQTNGLRVGLFGGYNALLNFSTSGSYTYTFPSATGTIALTSDIPSLAGYVTLATTQTITGAKTFSGAVTLTSSVTTNNLTFANSGFFLTLQPPTLSVNRTVTLPNGTGTLALTSDLTGGTVTSVAALTIGTSGTDLSSSVANSTTTPVITLNVPTASATNRGALSSADWTTFNNKQNALTNPVTGTGTTNYLPKFTGTSTIGNSNVTDTGSLITLGSNTNISSGGLGIGTTSLTGYTLRLAKSLTGSTSSFAARNEGVVLSDVTADAIGFRNDSNTQAAAFTLINYWHFWARQGTIGAGSAITNQYGYIVDSNMVGATNNYAFQGNIPSGTNRWNLYMAGTAANYMAGVLNIGTTTLSGYTLDVNGTGRFSGNVTIANQILVDSLFSGAEKNIKFYDSSNTNINAKITYDQISSNSGQLFFGTNNAGTFATRLTIASTGAATFSSSVTAGGTITLNNASANYATLNLNGAAGYGAELKFGEATGGYLAAIRHNYNVGTGLEFYTGGTGAGSLRMYIAPSGNVGIGTTSPNEKLDVNGAIQFRGDTQGYSNTTSVGMVDFYSGIARMLSFGADGSTYGGFDFYQAKQNNSGGRSSMRITSGGNVLIGTTDDGSGSKVLSYSTTAATQFKAAGTAPAITFTNTITGASYGGVLGACTSANQFISGTSAGDMVLANQFSGYRLYAVSYSGGVYLTSGATSWTANSDIRLKNINSHIENAVEKLSTLQTINFSYKDDKFNKQNIGLIAQEVEKIFPELIDKNGDGMLGVRYTELVPVLIKAVQELKLEIETLKNK